MYEWVNNFTSIALYPDRICHIAAELVKGLNKKHSEEPAKRPNGEQLEQPLIPPKDELCVLIAALYHDLGEKMIS